MSAQQDAESDATLASYLEGVAVGMVDAINARDFSQDSPCWQSVSPNFVAGLGDQRENINGLQQCLQVLSSMSAEHPLHKIQLLDMSTYLRKKTGRAEIYMNVKMNNPEGIIYSDVGILEFGMTTAGWKVYRYRAFTGFGHLAAAF